MKDYLPWGSDCFWSEGLELSTLEISLWGEASVAGSCGSKSTFQSPAGGQGYLTLLMRFCLFSRKPEASIAILHMHRKHTWEEAMKENSLSVLISCTCC